jgi:hypothetical protein
VAAASPPHLQYSLWIAAASVDGVWVSSNTVRPPNDAVVRSCDDGVDVVSGLSRRSMARVKESSRENASSLSRRPTRRVERGAARSTRHRERHRKRMPVLPPCAKANRAGSEKRDGAVHHLRNQRERLQCSRTELFEQEERREIAQVASCAALTAPRRFSSTSTARTSCRRGIRTFDLADCGVRIASGDRSNASCAGRAGDPRD